MATRRQRETLSLLLAQAREREVKRAWARGETLYLPRGSPFWDSVRDWGRGSILGPPGLSQALQALTGPRRVRSFWAGKEPWAVWRPLGWEEGVRVCRRRDLLVRSRAFE